VRKGLVLVIICSLLFLGGMWDLPVVHSAKDKVGVTVNFEPLKVPAGISPFVNSSVVMVPVRPVGEALGYEVIYIKEQNSLQLKGNGREGVIRLGEGTLVLGGKERLAIDGKAMIKNNRIYVPLSFFGALGLITSYDAVSLQAAVSTPQKYADNVVLLLNSGQFEELWQDLFGAELKKLVPVSALQSGWASLEGPYGTFVQLDSATATQVNGQTVIQAKVEFSKGNLNMIITVDNNARLTGLRFTPAAEPFVERELPEGLTEETVVVGEGTAHPLKGVLTLPEHSSGRLPSVVLVHGSGSTDLDETAFAYKPFRDIAWGLAQQGIAVLRYDKRSYVYPKDFIGDMAASFTVKEETVDDAILAAKLLKSDKRLDPEHVYLAGHSLGGMLAPRIDADGGDFAGLILLAGSPRKLWEIVYDQNMNVIHTLDDSNPLKAQTVSAMDGELMKAKALSSLTAEQAKQAPAVFGIPAYYLQEMQQHDTAELARKLSKPVLVMQGADDFQIFAGTDFPLWKEVLKNNAAAEFKLYPGLNHFFVNYDGAGAGTTEEYNVPGTVDPQVITDMGIWIKAQYY
jgi:uncharacterized protein